MTTLVATKKQQGRTILTEEEVLKLIREGQKDRSRRAYAAELGVSESYLADIYHNRRSPGESVLQHFGIRKVVKVMIEYIK